MSSTNNNLNNIAAASKMLVKKRVSFMIDPDTAEPVLNADLS